MGEKRSATLKEWEPLIRVGRRVSLINAAGHLEDETRHVEALWTILTEQRRVGLKRHALLGGADEAVLSTSICWVARFPNRSFINAIVPFLRKMSLDPIPRL